MNSKAWKLEKARREYNKYNNKKARLEFGEHPAFKSSDNYIKLLLEQRQKLLICLIGSDEFENTGSQFKIYKKRIGRFIKYITGKSIDENINKMNKSNE